MYYCVNIVCSIIQFYLKFDCRKQTNLSASEPVLLRYSTDGGIHWSVIGRYDAQSSTEPAYIVVNVPYEAKTHSTRIHWWQPVSDRSHRVDWAVDQVNKVFSIFQILSLLQTLLHNRF